ncbi:MAG: hypothetical protein NT123_14055 [Proteobacteria bacterium]|nr:hypothetical protein [Pseudomonadota bacterium]
MSEAKTRLSRRNFLLAAGASGAAGAAAIVATAVPPAPPASSANDKRKTKGYHASEHIRSYYNTTKI